MLKPLRWVASSKKDLLTFPEVARREIGYALYMTLAMESSGNVFEDLGFTNSKELLAKAELARQVYLIIKRRGLTQAKAAGLLGLRQPDVSLLMRGRLSRFSTDRLIQLLNRLDRDVEIVVKRKSSTKRKGSVRVIAA